MTTIDESDQVVQRRANLDELRKLGVAPYPHRFDARASIDEIVRAHGKTGETLDAEQVTNRTAGAMLAIRAFGKANFLVLSDGKSRIQVYLREDSLPRDFFDLQIARCWRLGRRRRTTLPHEDQGIHHLGIAARVSGEVSAPASGKVARPHRHRDALPAALSRSDRESRCAPRVRVRSRVVAATREFLIGRGFLEVETPMMQSIAGARWPGRLSLTTMRSTFRCTCVSRPSST